MTHIKIKCRWSDKVLFEGEYESTRHAVEAAVAARAYLADAYLARAYLAGANLARADLADANLAGANLADANLADADLAGANLADADLAGANLAGAKIQDEVIQIPPVQIYGLRWSILITPEYLKIGCQRHTHKEWKAFKRTDIAPMATNAWDWWKTYKETLLTLCAIHQSESERAKEERAAA